MNKLEYISFERINEVCPKRLAELKSVAICIDRRGLHLPKDSIKNLPKKPPKYATRLAAARFKLKRLAISWPGMVEHNKAACTSCEHHDPESEYKPGCKKMKDCGCEYSREIVRQPKVDIILGKEEVVNGCPLNKWAILQLKGSENADDANKS